MSRTGTDGNSRPFARSRVYRRPLHLLTVNPAPGRGQTYLALAAGYVRVCHTSGSYDAMAGAVAGTLAVLTKRTQKKVLTA
jgi:hypothetical protein